MPNVSAARTAIARSVIVAGVIATTACIRPAEQEPSAIFRGPLVTVRRAVFIAFERIGIDVTRDESLQIEGARPLRMKGAGIAGGETVRVLTREPGQ